jgi:hypothetical protein
MAARLITGLKKTADTAENIKMNTGVTTQAPTGVRCRPRRRPGPDALGLGIVMRPPQNPADGTTRARAARSSPALTPPYLDRTCGWLDRLREVGERVLTGGWADHLVTETFIAPVDLSEAQRKASRIDSSLNWWLCSRASSGCHRGSRSTAAANSAPRPAL